MANKKSLNETQLKLTIKDQLIKRISCLKNYRYMVVKSKVLKIVEEICGTEPQKKIARIIIEGHDEAQVYKLFEEIQNKYSLYDNCVIETEMPPEETILDKHRYRETGCLFVDKRIANQYGEKTK